LTAKAEELRRDGATALLGVDGKPGAVIAIADPVKRPHLRRSNGYAPTACAL